MQRLACCPLGRPHLPRAGLLLLGLIAVAAPARAELPSQSYLPPAAARHVARKVGMATARPAAPARRPLPPARPAVMPARRLPPPDLPLPDRAQQIIDMQLAPRGPLPTRALSPGEATAIWRGYTGRIGKPPGLGSAAGTGGGGGGGQ